MNSELRSAPLEASVKELRAKYAYERDRRIRADGRGQYESIMRGDRFKHFSKDVWTPPAPREPLESDHTRVVILGGGFGGLTVAGRLAEAGVTDIRVIDLGGDFGGTWYWNRYPGAMCDIEAHIYMPLLEELGYAPKHRYAYGDELFAYSQQIGRKYGLYEKALFGTTVTSAGWNEETQRWQIGTDHGDLVTADYFIVAAGRHGLPKLPTVPGIEEFEGHIFHSSRWDYDYTGGDINGGLAGLADKRVGVVGTGATSLQIVPAVAKDAKELLVFQRTPSTVGVRGQQPTDENWADMSQPGWQRARRVNFQSLVAFGGAAGGDQVKRDLVADGWTNAVRVLSGPADDAAEQVGGESSTESDVPESEMNDYKLMAQMRARVADAVKDQATAEALKPWYRFWCKRPGWHDEYLPAFNNDNVHLVDTAGSGIERFTPTGLIAGGKEYELDCVVMATGFEQGVSYTYITGFDIIGRAGRSLSDHWSEGVRTLHGMTTDGFPNLIFVGVNPQTAPVVNATHLLDEQARYAAHLITRADEHSEHVIEPEKSAVDDWVRGIAESPENQALLEFYLECTPGYFNGEGAAKDQSEIYSGGKYGPGALAYYALLDAWSAAPGLPGYGLGEPAPAAGVRAT